MKHRLGIAIGRLPPFQDETQSRLKGNTPLVIRRHVTVVGVAVILPIDDLRHSFKGVDDLILREDAVLQPIGDVLARNSERRPILHQRDIIDIRNFRTADALIDPANDIAQDALRIVIQLALNLRRRQLPLQQQRRCENMLEVRAAPFRQFALPLGDIDIVIVQRMKRRRGRRRHPGGVGAGLRMGNLRRL